MAQQRYDLRREEDGTWTVYDVFTGWAADLPSAGPAVGLDMEDADDLVDLLNTLDRERRGVG